MWWVYALLIVVVGAGVVFSTWLIGSESWGLSKQHALSFAFQTSGWACCIDPTVGLRQIPPDPTVVRVAETTWQQGTERGAVLVREQSKRRASGAHGVIYLWVRDPSADGTAAYVANMGRLEYGHGGRETPAAAIVRSITEQVPGLRGAWVVDHTVGVALDLREVTAPHAWTEWLVRVGPALAAGRPQVAPPARWLPEDA